MCVLQKNTETIIIFKDHHLVSLCPTIMIVKRERVDGSLHICLYNDISDVSDGDTRRPEPM